jgi:hypothetical protein
MVELRRIVARDNEGKQHWAFWTDEPSLKCAHQIVGPVQTAVMAKVHVTVGPVGAERKARVDLADYDSVLAAIEQWGLLHLVETGLPDSEEPDEPDSEPDGLVY